MPVTPSGVPDLTLAQILARARKAKVERRPRDLDAVAALAVREARRRFGRRKGIVSIHWGSRRARGQRTAAACVVITVRRKQPKHALHDSRVLPTFIDIKTSGRTRRVRVDVQAVGWVGRLHDTRVDVGASAEVVLDASAGQPNGALGAVVSGPSGSRVVLSGHVARQAGRTVFGCPVGASRVNVGRVQKVIRTPRVDVAWTELTATDLAKLRFTTAGVRDPGPGDVNRPAWVLVARDFRGLGATIDGFDESAPFDDGQAVVSMTGLVSLNKAITNPGDSGAPVVDEQARLIGFVVGVFGSKSYLIPARRAIDALED